MHSTRFVRAFAFGLLILASLPTAAAAQKLPVQETTIMSATLKVGDRPLWRKILRGVARGVTLGAVQAASDSIKKDQPFHVEANHDGIDTDSYTLFLNTAASSTVPVTVLSNGIVAFPRFNNGLPKGTYQIVVRATGQGGSTDSPNLALTVTAGNPSAPGQPRIIKQ